MKAYQKDMITILSMPMPLKICLKVVKWSFNIAIGHQLLPFGITSVLKTMRPAVLKRLKELAEQGANILGRPVDHSPSLTNFPACERQRGSGTSLTGVGDNKQQYQR